MGAGPGRKGVWPKSKKTDGARMGTEALQIGSMLTRQWGPSISVPWDNEVARGGHLCVRFGDGQNCQR